MSWELEGSILLEELHLVSCIFMDSMLFKQLKRQLMKIEVCDCMLLANYFDECLCKIILSSISIYLLLITVIKRLAASAEPLQINWHRTEFVIRITVQGSITCTERGRQADQSTMEHNHHHRKHNSMIIFHINTSHQALVTAKGRHQYLDLQV